jgi:hypothetical protein
MPFFVDGTIGKPASSDDGAWLPAVWGGGSVPAFGPHADQISALAAKIKQRPIDFIAMPETLTTIATENRG